MADSTIEEWLTEENLALIEDWYRNKLTDKDVAANMNISVATLYNWQKKSSKLKEAVRKGRTPIKARIRSTFFKVCEGFHETETTIHPDGSKTVYDKYYPPNITALIFALKNCDKENWRDKWDIEVNADMPKVIIDDA